MTLQAPIEGGRKCGFGMIGAGRRMQRVAVWKAEQVPCECELLFCTGIGANIEAISPLTDCFADRDLITFDMPGIGKSPNPIVPYTAYSMAWRSARVLDKLGYDKVDVMGVSWGGGLAQQFAFQH